MKTYCFRLCHIGLACWILLQIVSSAMAQRPSSKITEPPVPRGRETPEAAATRQSFVELAQSHGFSVEVETKLEKQFQKFGLPGMSTNKWIFTGPNEMQWESEFRLGAESELALAVSGAFKVSPDSKQVSGSGTLSVAGQNTTGKFSFDSRTGLELEAGVEESFKVFNIQIKEQPGEDRINLGVKLGPVKVLVDPVKFF